MDTVSMYGKFSEASDLDVLLLRLLDNSWICQLADCQLADWTTHRLDISRTGQLVDATDNFECLVFILLAASARPQVV